MGEAAARGTYADYLALEATAAQKHEFIDGSILAMAGGSLEHARLQARLTVDLTRLLGERPCVVYSSDARVRVEATNRSTYPDVTVVCGETRTALDDPQAITNPIVLIEVLSESTEGRDRGEKFAHYRRLPSLKEYLLVSQSERRIESFRRAADLWTFHEATAGGTMAVPCLGLSLELDEVYRDARG